MVDLEPCPFCGGEAEFSLGKTGDGKDWHYIECGECGVMGPHVKYADHNIAIKDALSEAWNRRSTKTKNALLREAAELVNQKYVALGRFGLRDAILDMIKETKT